MNCSWTLNENSTGVLTVTVDGEAWEKAQAKAFNNAKSKLNLKGFRKGQVPNAIAKKQISDEEVHLIAVDEVAGDALKAGMEEFNLELVTRPALNIKDASNEAIVLEFTCTVVPEVTLGDYKAVKVEKEAVEVTEEEVEAEVKRIQDRFADWVLREEDEEAQLGDQVVLDFVGEKDGVAFEGGSGENYPLELGSHTFIPGFEEQLIGIKADEDRDVNVTFPEDYHAADLAGQPVVFKVKAHEVKYKELPEVNDELIQKVKREGVETVEAFKEQTKADLLSQKEKAADDNFTDEVLNQVVAGSTVEVPTVMVETEVDRMYQQFEQRMQGSGFTAAQFLEATHQTVEDVRNQMREEAEKRVRTSLVLEAVCKAENIEVAADAVEAEYTQMSEMYNMPVEQIKSLIAPANIEYDLKQQKTVEFLKESAK